MLLSDLLFLVLFLTTVLTLLTAGWFLLRRQAARAGRILRRLLVGVVCYFAIVVGASLLLPRRVIAVGTPECFDDWCIAISAFERHAEAGQVTYKVNLRLSCRARRVAQREKNIAVYLTDHRGKRYDPIADPAAGAFDVLLQPQESVTVSRSFSVPTGATISGAVVTHEGGFPIGWFIIGYDSWFRKPAVTPLR